MTREKPTEAIPEDLEQKKQKLLEKIKRLEQDMVRLKELEEQHPNLDPEVNGPNNDANLEADDQRIWQEIVSLKTRKFLLEEAKEKLKEVESQLSQS